MKWRCASCEEPYRKKNPPCDRCGHMKIEKAVTAVQEDESEPEEPIDIEWRCTECNHKHVKNAPPCNRCGNMRLEKTEVYPSDRQNSGDSITPSRRGLVKYGTAGILVLLAGGYALADGASEPTIKDAPGQSNFANGINFQDAEARMLALINTERREIGHSALESHQDLKQMAEYHSKDMVTNDYYSAEWDPGTYQEFSKPRDNGYTLVNRSTTPIETYNTAQDLAEAIVNSWFTSPADRNILLTSEYLYFGADIHIDTTGDIYTTAQIC